ncbi:3'-5' exonuclease [Falsiroseomonas sp. CW058]|uniref:3'-5' exonuclease n=1 Tax=Falsiroseomonas sp. CW058 TaxID=3388664 RepID=UPI003D31526E
MRLAFLDLEASGNVEDSYPVEVGVAIPTWTGAGWTVTVTSWLIRPMEAWSVRADLWSPVAEAMHGLAPEYLRAAGTPAADVAAELDSMLAGHMVISDTGRHGWDAAWLSVLGVAVGDPQWPRRWRLARETAGELITGLAQRSRISSEVLSSVLARAPRHTHAAGEDALREAWLWCSVHALGTPPTISPESRYRRRCSNVSP